MMTNPTTKATLIATQSEWASLLSQVSPASDKSSTTPILASVLFYEKDSTLCATCTDLTLSLQATSTIACPTSLTWAVNERKLSQLLKLFEPDTAIKFTVDHGTSRLTVVAGKSRHVIQMLSAEDFPLIAQPDSAFGTPVVIPTEFWKTALGYTQPFMAVGDTRTYLNNLRLQTTTNPPCIQITATDGRRLAYYSDPTLTPSQDCDILLPPKSITEINRLLTKTTTEFSLLLSPSQLCVKANTTTLHSSLSSGKYPDIARIIPPLTPDTAISISRPDLIHALKRAAIMGDTKTIAVALDISATSLALKVSADSTSTANEANEELDITYSGTPLKVGYNIGYFLDALSLISSDTIELHHLHETKPLRIVDPSNPLATLVIMPVRL